MEEIIFTPTKTMMVDCYVDADFLVSMDMSIQNYPIYASHRMVYIIAFEKISLLWVPKVQMELPLSTLNSKCVTVSHYLREFLPLKNSIKEVIV